MKGLDFFALVFDVIGEAFFFGLAEVLLLYEFVDFVL